MSDRFKFRAWDKTENAYIEDAQFTYDDGCEGGMGSFRHYSFRDLLEDKNCIVEQCTGLKDKNGKLIYENDLIKIDDDVAVIKWSDYYARFMLESSEDIFDFETIYAEECEVIGNIHENADLLELKQDD